MRSVFCVIVLVALALGDATPSRAAGEAEPPGEVWVVTSSAECDGAAGTLVEYERGIAAQLDSAMAQLGRPTRRFATRSALLDALHHDAPRGWLFLFISGHGLGDSLGSRTCIGQSDKPGEWLDIDHDLLPALPVSLSGAIIVLDSCSSAHVDPRTARIPTAIVSASPYVVDTGALFGATVIAALAAATDDNCNGVFDDDDLFAGLSHRLQSSLSLTAFEAWPKLRRNAPSPLPLPVRARPTNRCAALWQTVDAIPATELPGELVQQRAVQAALTRGQLTLPRLDHDFFVIAEDTGEADAVVVRKAARAAGLIELHGLHASRAAALARTTSFADIYRLAPAFGWLETWRLSDGLLIAAVRLTKPSCGMPSRTVPSDLELVDAPSARYSQADRYLRDARDSPPGHAKACFEPEGQCFDTPAVRKRKEDCEP
ncbi:MAG: hypothetical protein E6J90_28815 [Deltaproteobacteria bacterium]|nr:MAG: hypothetical protein E6J91_39020 [Deltaproteobacteria bacterium]TMQ13364.1 MAG: hypothetical protein E6J90_28815 [Deltaproteobacteria bacterium]